MCMVAQHEAVLWCPDLNDIPFRPPLYRLFFNIKMCLHDPASRKYLSQPRSPSCQLFLRLTVFLTNIFIFEQTSTWALVTRR